MHLRRHFLEQVKAQLKALNLGGVWIQRIPPARAAYPSITIYAEHEDSQIASIHQRPREQDRIVSVSITGWVKGSPSDEKAEQDMDKLAEKIESVVTIPLGADDMYLVSTDFSVDEEEGEIHAITFIYNIIYCTLEFSPTV